MTAKNLARISITSLTIFAVKGAMAANTTPTTKRVVADYARPLSFEPNHGVADKQVDFLAHGTGYGLLLSRGDAVIVLERGTPANPNSVKSAPLRMHMVGANSHTRADALDQQASRSNYFIGSDAEKWQTNIPNYAKVSYRNVYPGVDLIYYGNQRQLEYDFVVNSGADPNRILLHFEGAIEATLDREGNVVTHTASGDLHWRKPIAYQEVNGTRKLTACAYIRKGAGRFAFKVDGYDPTKPLIIDPVLDYSTYLGGSLVGDAAADAGDAIADDANGNTYVTGWTATFDFPTKHASQHQFLSFFTTIPVVFITKFDGAGNLVYSTLLGGSGSGEPWDQNIGNAIAVDGQGNAYVTGETDSPDFPLKNPFQAQILNVFGGFTAFVTKLNAAGDALVYSTFLGGSGTFTGPLGDAGNGIAVDSCGNAYVGGETSSPDFPIKNAFQGSLKSANAENAFVTKLNATGTALVYSTYLGGSVNDGATAIAVDVYGNAFVAGGTDSPDFPLKNAVQSQLQGAPDAFVAKFDAAGTALVYSTYLGGSGQDIAYGIALDTRDQAYVTGVTGSPNFPIKNAIQENLKGSTNAFVTKFDAAGTALVHSTYLGGSQSDLGQAIAVDSYGQAYITGTTTSPDFPIKHAFQPVYGGGGDAFVTKLDVSECALVYSSYLGGSNSDSGAGIAVDRQCNAHLTGNTQSSNFPIKNAFQDTNKDGDTAFVTKISAH
jgi:Beta-propeller repeat